MNEIDILYDHYKDTIVEIKNKEKKRNKLFIIVLIHIFILFLITLRPDSASQTISDFIMEKWGTGLYFSINTVQAFFMISLIYCVIRYYQINIQIDKNYPYVHKLEKELSTKLGESIQREGKNYLKEYPKTQDIVYYCYKYIFPVLFSIALLYRTIINNTWGNWLIKGIEFFVTFFLIIINTTYLIDMKNQE